MVFSRIATHDYQHFRLVVLGWTIFICCLDMRTSYLQTSQSYIMNLTKTVNLVAINQPVLIRKTTTVMKDLLMCVK